MPAALLALALAAAGPGTHGRLSLGVNAGAGWASDAFVGAGTGAGALAELVPAARLDLSLSPRVKLRADGEASWVRFAGSGFTALGAAAAAEARLLADPWELSARGGAEHAAFSSPARLDGLLAAPEVTRSSAGRLALIARRRAGALLWRAQGTGALRRSETPDAGVWQRELALAAGAEWRAWDRLALLADGRQEWVGSARDAFASATSGAAAGAELRPAGELEVAPRALLEWTRFGTGAHERLGRLALELTHPLGPVTALLSWSWSHSQVRGLPQPGGDRTRASADRQLVLVAVRAGDRVLSW